MKYTFAQVLWSLIVQEAIGTIPSNGGTWPVFLSHTPDSPDDCITVYDTTGIKQGRLMAGKVIQREGAMVRVRAMSYMDGWTKGQAIVDLIDSVIGKDFTFAPIDFGADDELHEVRMNGITRESTLLAIGTEPEGELRRQLFTLNLNSVLSNMQSLSVGYIARVEEDEGTIDSVSGVEDFYDTFNLYNT